MFRRSSLFSSFFCRFSLVNVTTSEKNALPKDPARAFAPCGESIVPFLVCLAWFCEHALLDTASTPLALALNFVFFTVRATHYQERLKIAIAHPFASTSQREIRQKIFVSSLAAPQMRSGNVLSFLFEVGQESKPAAGRIDRTTMSAPTGEVPVRDRDCWLLRTQKYRRTPFYLKVRPGKCTLLK